MPVISRWCNCESKGWRQKRLHADWISRNARYRDGSLLEPFRKPKSGASDRVPLTHLRASVLKRWEEGERTGITLWREIKDQGYTGTQRSVYRYLETLKQAEVRATASPSRLQKFSATTAV